MQQSTQSRSSFVLNGRDTELFENTLRQGREVGSKNLFARASQSNNFQVIADFVQFLFTRVKKNEPQKVESLNKKSKEERSEQDEEQLSVHARLRALYQQLLRLQNAQQQTEQTQRDAIVLIQQLMHLEQEAQEEDDELEVDEDSDEESRRPFSETNPPDEELLTAQAWLPHLISRGEIDQLDLYLQLLRESKGVCGATWRPGQIAFKCRTCEKDPTCAICKDCFLNGDHEGHNYSLIKTSSGMCDCGDPDSWDVKGFCRNHSGPAHDPTEHLPSDFRNCVRAVFSGLVHSIYELTIIVPNTSDRNLIFAFEVLEDYCKQSPAIKRFVLQAMLDRDHNQQSRSILDLLLDHHIALPFAVGHWIYQFYSACIADAEFKKLFAIEFVKHYQKIMDNYFDMPQKSGLTHISSITVQLFTVPPIAELLCREHDLLSIMMSTLEEVSAKHLKDDKKRNRKVINAEMKKLFESNALWHYFHDLGYILMHKTIANEFLFDPKYFSVFLKFLAQYQYCVEVERIDSDDETWQTSVNFELRMFPKLFRYIIGGIDELNCEDESNKQALTNLQTAIAVNLSFLKEFITLDKLKYKKSPNPKLKEIVDFDTYQGPISFHIPLHKMISEILVPSVKKQQFTLKQLFNGVDSNLIPELLEHPLRICATISHVRNRLWARNNMHINEQAFYYNHDSWSDYAICMDVFFIQVCYCLMNPELFFTTTLDRYKHNEMFLLTVPESMEPDQHQLMNLLELDYLHFVLTIWSDRSLSALEPASVARKFILHSLFVSQGTFSSLQECVPKQFRIGVDIEEIVRDVADYHSPQSQEQGYFTVKKKYWSELDPYFIHYSPKQFSKIEENYRKLFHKDLTHALPSPDKPYDTMAPVATLIHHSAFHRYLFVVLYRTLNNEHTSESLTICALNAIYLSIETLPYEYLSEEKISLIDNPPQVGGLYQLNFPSENNILVNVKQEFLVEGARQKRSILSMLLDLSDKKDKNKEIERLVGRVLKALCDYDESCKVVIDKHKTNLGKDTSDKEREKKRKRALARQQKIMTSLSSKKIDESLFGEAPATPEEVNQEERKCAFCHEAVSPNGTRNFGMISHLTLSNTLNIVEAQNLDEENKSTSTGNGRDVSSPNYQQLKLENDLVDRFKPSNLYIGKYDELFSDIKANKCVQMNCCSHVCHFDCYDSYFTSLLTTNRRYKGYNLINLQNKEILCPVCGRLANELCPIVHELSEERVLMGVSAQKPLTDGNSDFTFDLKTLKKGFKATIDSKELLNAGDYNWKDTNSVFSLQTTLKNYFSRVMCLHKGKKTGNLDTDEKHIDPSVLGSSLAYTLASHETAQRTIEQSDPKLLTSLRQSEIEQFTTMIESARAYHLLNNSTRQLSQEHLIALYNTIFAEGSILLINHQAEKEDDQSKSKPSPQKAPETMIAPFLTNDLYSLFVKLVLLKPSLVDWKEYSTILQVFYLAHIIQSLLVINCRYKTVSMTTSSKIASEIPPTEFGKIASANEWIASSFITSNQSILKNLSTKIVNLSNEEQVMKSLSLTFMRRMALFTSVLFDTHIPKLDADYDIELLAEQERYGYEFDKLRKWLDLPELSTVFQHLHDGSDSAILASKWLNQLSHSLNTTASYQQPPDKTISIINRLVPKYTLRPRQFHFIELPKLYQTLYLKYHNAECPHCSKKLQLPALCLITGQLVWLKQCDCAASRSREDTSRTVGKCTEFARAHFCGFGFYLIIPLSTVLCLRETRKSILPAFYLDQHGEADNQLQRGVALYLNQSRLNNYIKHFVRGDWDQDTILLEGTDGVQAYRL